MQFLVASMGIRMRWKLRNSEVEEKLAYYALDIGYLMRPIKSNSAG